MDEKTVTISTGDDPQPIDWRVVAVLGALGLSGLAVAYLYVKGRKK